MTKPALERKLTAIFSADVKGYSILMADNEEATIHTITTYRSIMSGLIEKCQGRVVDSPGDNLLAEFKSAVNAVQCAVEIQQALHKENEPLPKARRMVFRIGINIGDIAQEGNRIYGDGVNRAARIEGISEPGGICISRNVYDHVKEKLNFGYEYIGEHALKNIKDPVRVYKVLMDPKDAGKLIGEKHTLLIKNWVWSIIVVTAIIFTLIGYQVFQKITAPDFEPASIEKMAYPLPDKPSIAVLPFDDMSENKNQEYIADGLTDNIITTLSKIHNLFVIARNSSSIYKGKPVKVQQVSEELGVRYVLEGSVQRSGDRVRVIAQLIDAIDGKHLWSERYDRHFKDIFELIDEITSKIANSLRIELILGEGGELWNKNRPSSLEFNEKLFEAASYAFQINKEANIKAKQLSKEMINLEPAYYAGYFMLAFTHLMDVYLVQSSSPAESLGNAMKLCKQAIALDESQDGPHWVIGDIYLLSKKYDKAIAESELAIALNPNSVPAYQALGRALIYSGRPEEAIEVAKKASRLSPINLSNPELGYAYSEAGQYQEALAEFKKGIKTNPKSIIIRSGLTMTYALAGRYEEARKAWSEVLKLDTMMSVEKLLNVLPANADKPKRILTAFNQAGITDYPSVEKMDKPSIAVLPFVNMSKDPEQEYFCDGMTENLISVLAQAPQLLVIARNSTFAYKDKSIDVRQIGQELGAQYVIEGSIQKSDDRYRFVVQLIDTDTGVHIWSERYDREFKDIFKLQDEITLEILKAAGIKVITQDQYPGIMDGIGDINSFIILAKLGEYLSNPTRQGFDGALRNVKKIISANPEYLQRYDMLASVYLTGAAFGSCKSIESCLLKAENAIKKSFSLDENSWMAHHHSGFLFGMKKEHDKAILAYKKAIELNPNNAGSYFGVGWILNNSDKPVEALEYLNKAIRLNPVPSPMYLANFGMSFLMLGQYEKAIKMYKRCLKLEPNYWYAYGGLAITYSYLGQEEKAKTAVRQLLNIFPDYSIEFIKKNSQYKTQDQLDRIIEAYRKAGLPEQ